MTGQLVERANAAFERWFWLNEAAIVIGANDGEDSHTYRAARDRAHAAYVNYIAADRAAFGDPADSADLPL